MSKYFNRGHYGLQSATERLSKEWSASDLKQQASLYLDFANGEYFTRSLSDSGTPKQFGDILTFTRDSDKTGFAPVGLATVGADVPALPLDPSTGERLGISIHGQHTNLITRSENFSAGQWFGEGGTTRDGDTINFQPTSAAAFPAASARVLANVDVGERLNRTFTFLAILPPRSNSSDPDALIHIGLFGATGSPKIKNIPLTDKFQVFHVTGTGGTSGSLVLPAIACTTEASITGIRTQVTETAFPTPYIKTEGTTVTRLADNCRILDIDQSDWWSPNEGTFVVKFQGQRETSWTGQSPFWSFGLSLSTANTSETLSITKTAGNQLTLFFRSAAQDSPTQTVVSMGEFVEGVNSVAFAYDASAKVYRGSANGGNTAVMNLPAINFQQFMDTIRAFYFNGNAIGSSSFASLTYIPRAMTAEELQSASQLGGA